MTTTHQPKGEKMDETKREKRRAANRRSARKSRYREMVMLEELQRHSQSLTDRNSMLKMQNGELRELIRMLQHSKARQEIRATTPGVSQTKYISEVRAHVV